LKKHVKEKNAKLINLSKRGGKYKRGEWEKRARGKPFPRRKMTTVRRHQAGSKGKEKS